MISTKTRGQFVRYALVGLGSNVLLYLVYLTLSFLGIGHKTAMTLLYIMGIAQTFLFNKTWSFQFAGAASSAFIRYVAVYSLGYVINFLALAVLVDQANLPHKWVMAGLILFMAIFFFVVQKFWVFR